MKVVIMIKNRILDYIKWVQKQHPVILMHFLDQSFSLTHKYVTVSNCYLLIYFTWYIDEVYLVSPVYKRYYLYFNSNISLLEKSTAHLGIGPNSFPCDSH